jgi:hypothetical protein
MIRTACFVLLLALSLAVPLAAEAQVSVNVNVGPPPVIFAAPPRVVLVPQTPVYYAPDTSYNVFFYEGRYYSYHNGAWFLANGHGGPWALVPIEAVPRPVIGVPVRYYKIPPGQLKKMERAEHRERGEWRDCPPGHAKHGRC